MKVFLSYGRDRNTPIVLRIKHDLEASGHSVWIDVAEIKTGDDWRRSIVDGLSDTDWTLGFLSRHSVRDPGVCLDELAIALHVKAGAIATVLLEAEVHPPVSISHIQWLDMHDWSARLQVGGEDGERWYQSKLREILAVLASPANVRFSGEIEQLERELKPILQDADIGTLLDGFIGREWLRANVDDWRRTAHDSRLLWINGAPGTGKSAFAAWLAHRGMVNVIALNLCRYNVDERRDPTRILRTIAFQIASRLPDYRRLLCDRLQTQDPQGHELEKKSAAALFDWLLAEPLRFGIGGGRHTERFLVVIDALDETIQEGRSELTEVLAECCPKLPDWIAFVVTSRPEPAIVRQLSGLKPQLIVAESDANLDDLRAYARRWLSAAPDLVADDVETRIERLVTASEGNFLYLRKLQEAVAAGLMDLAHPDGLPQGLVGLYERWFRRKFPSAADFDRCRPLLEVLVAAEHPVPEAWLARTLNWVPQSQSQTLEEMGSLIDRAPNGVSLFHKSIRDWLKDDRSAGANFALDRAAGARQLTSTLLGGVEAWARAADDAPLDGFCELELFSQLRNTEAGAEGLSELAGLLADPQIITRRFLRGTDAGEERRRTARGRYLDLVRRVATVWPVGLDGQPLVQISAAVHRFAWAALDDLSAPRDIVAWAQVQPAVLAPHMPRIRQEYFEWKQAMLSLVTAITVTMAISRARPDLNPELVETVDLRLFSFIRTDAYGLIGELLGHTGGVEYEPERNMSFIADFADLLYKQLREDPRVADAVQKWEGLDPTS